MDFGKMVDVTIGLSMMFLMLSLFCTIINEFIATQLKLRSNTLKMGLAQMAGDCPKFREVFNHPLVGSAKPDELHVQAQANAKTLSLQEMFSSAQGASYITGRGFASAVLDTINPNIQLNDTATYEAIMGGVKALPPGRLQNMLRATVNNTTADVQKVRDSIAHWFDGEMDRVEGGYKRYLQLISFLVGLMLAIALNADTIHVGKVLWQDHDLAAKIADSAAHLMANDKAQGQTIASLATAEKAVSEKAAAFDAAAKAAAANPNDADKAKAAETAKTEMDNAVSHRDALIPAVLGNVAAYKNALTPFPIGWAEGAFVQWLAALYGQGDFFQALVKFAGWFFTAMALTLGAPFWFDTLGKVVNLRSAGSKPATTAQLQQAEQGQ